MRQGRDGIEFRLWHSEHPQVWEKHGWVPQAALEAAAALYTQNGRGASPMALYDIAVATALLKEEERNALRENTKPGP